jgi:hypothetical protein
MTTQAERPSKVYTCLVEEKAEGPDGSILSLEIPAFDSKYPTKVTRVEPVLAQQLKVGAYYDLRLERQNLKKGKSGDKAYDYYWGLKGLAGAGEVRQPAQDAPQGPAVAPRGMPAGVGEVDPYRRSVERNTQLMVAGDITVAYIKAGLPWEPKEIVEMVQYYHGIFWEEGGQHRQDDDFPPEERFEEQDFPD